MTIEQRRQEANKIIAKSTIPPNQDPKKTLERIRLYTYAHDIETKFLLAYIDRLQLELDLIREAMKGYPDSDLVSLARTLQNACEHAEELSDKNEQLKQQCVDQGRWLTLQSSMLKKRSWQPIETAPKDGTQILVAIYDPPAPPDGIIRNTFWDDDNKCWAYLVWSMNPRYWMPIPELPEATE